MMNLPRSITAEVPCFSCALPLIAFRDTNGKTMQRIAIIAVRFERKLKGTRGMKDIRIHLLPKPNLFEYRKLLSLAHAAKRLIHIRPAVAIKLPVSADLANLVEVEVCYD